LFFTTVPVFVVILNESNFLDDFSKNTAKSDFMDIRPVVVDLLPRANGRTDGQTEKNGYFYKSDNEIFRNTSKKRISMRSGGWGLPWHKL